MRVPRLSDSMNQWLLPSVTMAAEDFQLSSADNKTVNSTSSMLTGSWMRDQTPPFGVQQWLCDIQNDSTAEEEHFHQSFEMLNAENGTSNG